MLLRKHGATCPVKTHVASVVFYSPVDPGSVSLGDGWDYMVLPIIEDSGQLTIRLVQVDTSGDKPRMGQSWVLSPEVLPNPAEALARIRTGFELTEPWHPHALLSEVMAKGLILQTMPTAN